MKKVANFINYLIYYFISEYKSLGSGRLGIMVLSSPMLYLLANSRVKQRTEKSSKAKPTESKIVILLGSCRVFLLPFNTSHNSA